MIEMYHRSGERAFGFPLTMEWNELPALFPEIKNSERWLPLLERHLAFLTEASVQTRVTSVPSAGAVQRHYAESLEIWRIATVAPGSIPATVVDVGSGGGFPGMVMACVAPNTSFVLVEPLQKRARLLEAIASALELSNVCVLAQRAEDAGRGPFREAAQLVTARAVAPLAELLEYTAPFCEPGGVVALPKGSGLSDELESAENAVTVLGLRYSATRAFRRAISETLSMVLFEKVAATPGAYPRRAGLPGKRPL